LGILEDLFAARGWAFSYLDVPAANLADFGLLKPDLLVVLGGPVSVKDTQDYPFTAHEPALLKPRLDADIPTLGICLGAHVYPGPEREIGWKPLLLSAAGQGSPVRHLSAGETFDLPEGATLLAGTEACLHQIFAWGSGTLAFQCHPEVRLRELETGSSATRWKSQPADERPCAVCARIPCATDHPLKSKARPASESGWIRLICSGL